jgi:mono/diheme cytochrome c family protein
MANRFGINVLATAALAAAVFAGGAFATTPTTIVGNVKNGKKLFKAHDCGTCHIMSAAGYFDSSSTAPNLDHTRKTYAQIILKITNGNIAKGMNPYKRVLTTSQIQDLAAFIYKSAHPS